MTVIMIIAIVVAVTFAVYCALSLLAIEKCRKDIREKGEIIDAIENKLGEINNIISYSKDIFDNKELDIEKHQAKEILSNKPQSNEETEEEKDIDEIDFDGIYIEEIEEDIDIDRFIANLSATENNLKPLTQKTNVTIQDLDTADAASVKNKTQSSSLTGAAHFQGYYIGRSGRKYTESELIELIEE